MELAFERDGSIVNLDGGRHLDGEDAMRSGRLLVHLGLANVPLLLGTVHQVENIGGGGDTLLGKSSTHHTVLALHHGHLVVAIGKQIAKILVVNLQIRAGDVVVAVLRRPEVIKDGLRCTGNHAVVGRVGKVSFHGVRLSSSCLAVGKDGGFISLEDVAGRRLAN